MYKLKLFLSFIKFFVVFYLNLLILINYLKIRIFYLN